MIGHSTGGAGGAGDSAEPSTSPTICSGRRSRADFLSSDRSRSDVPSAPERRDSQRRLPRGWKGRSCRLLESPSRQQSSSFYGVACEVIVDANRSRNRYCHTRNRLFEPGRRQSLKPASWRPARASIQAYREDSRRRAVGPRHADALAGFPPDRDRTDRGHRQQRGQNRS